MNRRYYLKNEKGQTLEINDMKNSVFNLISDLKTSKDLGYAKVGNTFLKNKESMQQSVIEGTIKFIKSESENEENYNTYERFIRTSEKLTFVNIRKVKNGTNELQTDVDWSEISRGFQAGNILYCNLILHCTTAWYKKNNLRYTIEENSESDIFGFPIDFENMRFKANEGRINTIENIGYSEAPIYVKIKGPVLNPQIQIIKDKNVIQNIEIPIELDDFEELEYCTRDDNILIRKNESDGTAVNLFDLLDKDNLNNFFKLPIGVSNLVISAETDIGYAEIIIYIQY